MILIKIIKHLHIINKHRFKVFVLSCKVGIPILGLKHDLSKYSPTEFFEGVKYFSDGKCSPIINCKRDIGYSKAWLHHKGRNKHHSEYWVDLAAPLKTPIIPFKYSLEMICDRIAACKTYQGKRYSDMSPYYYWNKHRDEELLNKRMQSFLTEVFELLGLHGEKIVLKKKYLKRIYDKHMMRKGINNYGKEVSSKTRKR